ncbi:hypothetical protein BX616_009316 [Lobosporangium transversale]|uniref:RING-type E3 ubiquitin transferase n=1 Tax=Lobosporangium transversale TaxID=64571 RepID=A0A1Y2GLJ0_9FUNG|nr:hypothetical protein BCR41DRAFT_354880 [Lobosporangium transversale]KAF9913914.1 hypothetical protein BX616_009316 [Lobosporangium transversale]ORZ14439.1 hypothetical protein BCR41DRAFT_354880 [Lobosporangium transversale]|eukprot:XP_021880917.1 hypothetical protein BCR41DRAFT_354880 [Lobosporangium transversale]
MASSQTRLCRRLLLLPLLSLFLTILPSTQAGIFGASVARLNYDRITVRNQPSSIGQADSIAGGGHLAAGIILKTGDIPEDGLSGVLFDMGFACTPDFDPSNTLPSSDFYGLPRIALIQRGGPNTNDACTFRTKILHAQANNSIAAIIYNGPSTTAINSATAALENGESPLEIPGVLISHEDGLMLKNLLQQTQNSGTVDFFNRVRISMKLEDKIPVIWEFVLIVVVVMLAISLTVSAVLHCRLYALRQRIRMDALARGADVLPNGTIRMRKVTLDKATLDGLPVRIYRQPRSSSIAAVSSPTGAAATQEGQSKTLTAATLSRSISNGGSISGQSVRSQRAVAAATALNASTHSLSNPASTPTPVNGVEGISDDTCAVCIDEFVEGEEIRMLPCHHEFHCECIDPWLIRKSSTCPLCKYDCLPRTEEEIEGRGEDANIVIPNDRLMEFIMGPDWVAAQTLRGHNGSSRVDRIGHFFGVIWDRLRGRPPRPPPRATIPSPASALASPRQQQALYSTAPNRMVQLDENGQVPLQLITPRGISAIPTLVPPSPSQPSSPMPVSESSTTPVPAPEPTAPVRTQESVEQQAISSVVLNIPAAQEPGSGFSSPQQPTSKEP